MNLQDSEGVALGSVLAERKAGNLAIEQLHYRRNLSLFGGTFFSWERGKGEPEKLRVFRLCLFSQVLQFSSGKVEKMRTWETPRKVESLSRKTYLVAKIVCNCKDFVS